MVIDRLIESEKFAIAVFGKFKLARNINKKCRKYSNI